MDAIGLNPIKLDAIGLDPIRMNAIRLGVPGASSGSGRPYIDPELLSHVKMAISTWGKTNDDPDRAVLKDLSGNGNDMRLLNFGFAGNSGYGMYGANYMDYTSNEMQLSVHTDTKISGYNQIDEVRMAIKLLVSTLDNIPSYKIKVTNLVHTIRYYYIDPENPSVRTSFPIKTNGVYELPASRNDIYNGESVANVGFAFDGNGGGATIEQLPDFEGWLCTDGVDDIIESVKPVSEMLEGSNEITVVSIIHGFSAENTYTNVIRESGSNYIRNIANADNKTGIYGYTCKDTTKSIITEILGDKNDYKMDYVQSWSPISANAVFSAVGARGLYEKHSVAYAGGFIANKVLTTDEINQIIAYFNLDRPGQIIKPQLYCNIKKQGITNDNHAEFNDQLINFVGGRNIQLNNVAWEGESGINSYPVVFGANKTWYGIQVNDDTNWKYDLNPNKVNIRKASRNSIFIYSYFYRNGNPVEFEIPSFKVKISGIPDGKFITYYYISETSRDHKTSFKITEDGEYTLPKSYPVEVSENIETINGYVGWQINVDGDCDITLEILPTIENALCLDGISDFGKATGLPVLKDYTVVADREAFLLKGGIVSKSNAGSNGAFIFNNSDTVNDYTYSFGSVNSLDDKDYSRKILYQSKYIYNGSPIKVGTSVDSDSMWLGTIRDGDSRFSKLALWSLMLFPYSLSEFLLERQLRKYKAGTLYPDMIEFRPVIKSNVPYSSISYSVNPGVYVTEGSTVTITITLSNASDKLVGVSSNAIGDISISGDNGVYEVTGKVTKSPQKINIVISSYLTMLNNDTLISNETLIKNE